MSFDRSIRVLLLLAPMLLPAFARAEAPPASPPASQATGADVRYGWFNVLDKRSRYGQGWFPEALRGPEADVEEEIRVDWFHSEKRGNQFDEVRAEFEGSIGLLTLEVEIPYVRDRSSAFDPALGRSVIDREEGLDAIELSARHPIFQYVSKDNFFDYTLVAALEVAVPSQTRISHDTEIVPQFFQLMRFGEHLSLQTSVGYSTLIGPDAGGTQTLEYSAVLGYALEKDDLKLPWIERTIPLFELTGDYGLAGEDSGVNRLFGTIGVRFNLKAIGEAQPRVGFGYIFPIDKGGRDDLRWGFLTSLVLEF